MRMISIIIPVYNEESTICALQDSLESLKTDCEILFVDGGSSDRTLAYIRPEHRVIASEKGRALQMNTGAQQSTGEILFFLHGDSILPETALMEIDAVMQNYRVGCFGIDFASKHLLLWFCKQISNHRIKDRKVMFGDQGIFIERELFFELGMFQEMPLMEDYQLSLDLKARNIPIGTTYSKIITSDRRFAGSNLHKLRIMWLMNRLRAKYRRGVPIDEIANMYQDIR